MSEYATDPLELTLWTHPTQQNPRYSRTPKAQQRCPKVIEPPARVGGNGVPLFFHMLLASQPRDSSLYLPLAVPLDLDLKSRLRSTDGQADNSAARNLVMRNAHRSDLTGTGATSAGIAPKSADSGENTWRCPGSVLCRVRRFGAQVGVGQDLAVCEHSVDLVSKAWPIPGNTWPALWRRRRRPQRRDEVRQQADHRADVWQVDPLKARASASTAAMSATI